MLRFALQRLIYAIPTVLVLATLTFFLMHAAPGGPFDRERALAPQVRQQVEAAYDLDKPVWRQYLIYLGRLSHGDLGPSFQYPGFTVNELIASGFPVSLKVGGLAMLLALAGGVTVGAYAALRQKRFGDYASMSLAMTGIALPNFVIAPLLVLFFALGLGWLPAGGWEAGQWQDMVLPVVALALPQLAYLARLTRGSMVEVLRSDFLRTARAKGLPERTVIARHALRPALMPVVSYLGPATAALITGSVVIEQIFSIPGLGRHFIQGALNRDYTVVMGVVIFYGVLIVALNFIVDLSYGALDPRVRQR